MSGCDTCEWGLWAVVFLLLFFAAFLAGGACVAEGHEASCKAYCYPEAIDKEATSAMSVCVCQRAVLP